MGENERYIQQIIPELVAAKREKVASGGYFAIPPYLRHRLDPEAPEPYRDQFSLSVAEGPLFTSDNVDKIKKTLKMIELAHYQAEPGENWKGHVWELSNEFYTLTMRYDPDVGDELGYASIQVGTAEEADYPISQTLPPMVSFLYDGITRVSGSHYTGDFEEYGQVKFEQFPLRQDPDKRWNFLRGRKPEVSSSITLFSTGQVLVEGEIYPPTTLAQNIRESKNVVFDAIKDKAKDRVQRLKGGFYGKNE